MTSLTSWGEASSNYFCGVKVLRKIERSRARPCFCREYFVLLVSDLSSSILLCNICSRPRYPQRVVKGD